MRLAFPPSYCSTQGVRARFDVDGGLNDGGLYLRSRAKAQRFHILDWPAQACRSGITTRNPGAHGPIRRGRRTGVEHVPTARGQGSAAQDVVTLGLDWTQAAAIGDDWPDGSARRWAFARDARHAK